MGRGGGCEGLVGTRSHTVASVGRKAAGSLATAPRTAEAAAGKGGRWRPLTPIDALHRGLRARWPRTRARPPVRAGRGPGGEEGLSEPAINPTHHGRRSGPGTGPAPSRGEKIRSGGGDSNNFVARPSHSQHQNKPDLKKKKKIPSPNCAAAPEREQRSILHPPPPPSSPPPTPPPPNAQRQAAAAAATAAAAEAEAVAARPAPCAAVQAKGEGRQAPPPKRRRPIDLKDLYRKNPHVQSKPEEWVHIHSLSFILLPRFLRNSSDQEFLFIFLMYVSCKHF
ncbi:sterile alpha motif domain-containing protein 1-like [Equus asinus]|uniref:sterile alpha motif domain-containing protein 1-like n=1 Tax=Equus asinus TaxID=9793 RepID=UPI0038F72C92